MFMYIMCVLGAFLGLYWIYLGLQSQTFYDLFFGVGDDYKPKPWPSESYISEYKESAVVVPPELKVVLPRKNFGRHLNPLALDGQQECLGDFEQFDQRTWQCVECHLVRFEKPISEPMEASSHEPSGPAS